MLKSVVTLSLCACLANAGDVRIFPAAGTPPAMDQRRHAGSRHLLWKVSLSLLVASQIVDAQSSWGYHEGNGLLQSQYGTFGGKAIGVKIGVTAAVAAVQWAAHRKSLDPLEGSSGANLVMAGLTAGMAARNYQIRSRCSP